MTDELTVALSPAGHLLLRPAAPGETALDERLTARLLREADRGGVHWLLHLGWVEAHSELSALAAYWRDLSRSVVSAFCTAPEVEQLRERIEIRPAPDFLSHHAASAPPMPGAEYLSEEVLERLWLEVLEALREEVREHAGESVQALLASRNPAWHVVGKVHLHLAENRNDEDHPFAFLASYTTGLSESGKPKHRPLGDAVRESASAKDKARLLALLAPVKRAAEQSALLKALVDSGALFRPLRWSPREAHAFLQQVSALEDSGVVVRVPDWWKAKQPPRPAVNISLGKKAPATLGLEALLDFDVSVSLDGEPLTAQELKQLKAAGDGLVLLKGKWVEMDSAKLEQVLAHWRAVQEQTKDGLSFGAALRLLSGVSLGASASVVEEREWSQVHAGKWLAEQLKQLREPDGALADPGDALKTQLRPYQRLGVQWLWFLTRLQLGACLADDMGLGKTVQVLSLLLLLRERQALAGPHLLVVPASLLSNWEAEAARFAPSLKLLVGHPSRLPSKSLRESEPAEVASADLVVTSYGTVSRLPWLMARRWGLVVLDEAQAIKNPGAQQTRAVKELKGAGRLALTGTPVENRLADLWSLFDFLNPGLLGSSKQFSDFVKRSTSYGPLRELTRPYILRRLKTDRAVISDLPEKTELKANCSLTKRQAALYQQAIDELKQKLGKLAGIERRGVVLSYLMRLKQICNHPSQWLADGAYEAHDSGKHERLAELCEVISSRQEKVLVFTQFKEMTQPLSSWLTRLFGRPGLLLSGATAVKQRQALVKRFQEDDALPYFVLSLKAGGTGLNLTAASHVIHFDRWWNPAVENQATDRAFRIGQKKNVLVHKFVCKGTVEDRVDELIESKRALASELLEGGGEVKLTELDDAALLKMVSLDLNAARAQD